MANDRVQWIRFKGLEGGHIGILDIYASNLASERGATWNEMSQSLLVDCRWIITGDFNLMENPLDRSTSLCNRFMGLKEDLAWTNIKNKYNIKDNFSKDEGPLYSWDNIREDGIRVLAKLDRFYSFLSSIQNPSSHIMHYQILGDSTSPIVTWPLSKLTLATTFKEVLHGKQMGDSS